MGLVFLVDYHHQIQRPCMFSHSKQFLSLYTLHHYIGTSQKELLVDQELLYQKLQGNCLKRS